jgi:hypothetical protein
MKQACSQNINRDENLICEFHLIFTYKLFTDENNRLRENVFPETKNNNSI